MKLWIHAARPKTLGISVCPVFIGGALAYADHQFHLRAFLASLFGAMFIQIGTNFANDYFDFFKGADTSQRLGPMKVLQAGLIKPQHMFIATSLAFAVAALFGTYLVYRAGMGIAVLGSLSIACGFAYTAGPFSLAYLGVSELFVIAFFGIGAVTGTYFVQTLAIKMDVVFLGLVPGLLGCAPLVLNNLRDYEQDRRVNKNTLVVRFGKKFAKGEFLCAMLFPFIALIMWAGFNARLVALGLGMLAFALIQVRCVWKIKHPTELNGIFVQVGKMIWLLGPLFFLLIALQSS